ncbi:hypothetical protein J3F83DRAFT_740535 [Trichoderma novae-zelandiae]
MRGGPCRYLPAWSSWCAGGGQPARAAEPEPVESNPQSAQCENQQPPESSAESPPKPPQVTPPPAPRLAYQVRPVERPPGSRTVGVVWLVLVALPASMYLVLASSAAALHPASRERYQTDSASYLLAAISDLPVAQKGPRVAGFPCCRRPEAFGRGRGERASKEHESCMAAQVSRSNVAAFPRYQPFSHLIRSNNTPHRISQ